MRGVGRMALATAMTVALALPWAGCSGQGVPPFSSGAQVLVGRMHTALKSDQYSEIASVVIEAENLYRGGVLTKSDIETLRRVGNLQTANEKPEALRLFETAAGLRDPNAPEPSPPASAAKPAPEPTPKPAAK